MKKITKTVNNSNKQYPLSLQPIHPKNKNQHRIFQEFEKDKNLFIYGAAGTGKSIIALYLALDSILNYNEFDQLIIIRSAVPSRRQGFLPGDAEEKNEIFELPYEVLFSKLFNDDKAYRQLKGHDKVKFVSTSYLRGITLENCIVLVEEVQNFNEGELCTVMTRFGENCRVIVTGDKEQDDLIYLNEDSCIDQAIEIFHDMPSFFCVEMGTEDVVRNQIVKEFIYAKKKIRNVSKSMDL